MANENNSDIDRGSAAGDQMEAGLTPTSPPEAVESPQAPAGGKDDAGGPPSPAETSPSSSTPQPSGQWPKSAVDRVAKLTARLREYEARGAGAPRPVDPSTGRAYTAEQIDAMVTERAQLVATQTAFNTRCNDAASRGVSRFPDWQVKLNGLTQLIDQTDARSIQQYNMFLEAALETGDAEGIIYRLGSNLNEAARVLALSPMKMAMEVGKLGEGKNDVKPSGAPKPIRPVGSTSPVTGARPDDPERGGEMNINDWMKAREKQAAERRIR